MIKSKYDNRKYKIINFKNKLNAILIYDKNCDFSSASLNISVGCNHDPPDVKGLAHFLEHMLFMGTKKYPDENDFSQYLSKNNGMYNAFTAKDMTNYHFSVNPSAFEMAIDKFAHFFINPLFKKNSIDKEINAIESEHSKNLQNDFRRSISVLRILSKENHTFTKFCTGNLETLRDIPKKNNTDIYSELLKFYNKWYSSNLMNLVVIHNKPIKTIEKIINIFSKIKNKNTILPIDKTNPLNIDQSKIIYYKPVLDSNILSIYWFIDSKFIKYFRSSIIFILELLNYNGEKSIMTILKKKDLIFHLSISYLEHINLSHYMFYVSFVLTDKGLNNINQIIEIFYKYMNYISNINKTKLYKIFKNINNIAKLNFMFKSKEESMDYVINLAINMSLYEKKYYLLGDYVMRKFDYKQIKYIFKNLLENKNIVMISSKKKCKNKKLLIEKYYSAEYSIENNNYQYKYKYNNVDNEIKKNIYIPEKNIYMPNKFKMVKIINENIYPIKLHSDNFAEIWFKQDFTFNKPHTYLFVNLINPLSRMNTKHYVLNNLFVNILNEQINTILYEATKIGYNIYTKLSFSGIILICSGYSNKFNNVIDKFIEILKKPITKNLFKNNLDELDKFYHNEKYNGPINQTFKYMGELLIENNINLDDMIKEIKKIKLNDILNYQKSFLKQLYLKFLFQGNIDENKSMVIVKKFKSKLSFNQIDDYLKRNIIKINKKRNIISKKSTNKNDIDSGIMFLYQIGYYDYEIYLTNELLFRMIQEPFFNQLRTNEQLGYIVRSDVLDLDNTTNIIFQIQSAVKSPDYLEKRIDDFLKKFKQQIIKMNEQEFEKYILSMIEVRKKLYTSIEEEFNFNVSEIIYDRYIFNRKEIEITFLAKINKKKLLNLFDKFITNNKRNLVIKIHGKSSNDKKQNINLTTKDIKKGIFNN